MWINGAGSSMDLLEFSDRLSLNFERFKSDC